MDHPAVSTARRLSDQVLFPLALETDAAPVVPVERLDRLADAGLYGLAGPADAGGMGLTDEHTGLAVIELLAGGCLSTTFIWMQHHSTVRALATAPPSELRDCWLGPLCRGELRAGVAFSGLRRPGPPLLTARPAPGGWIFDGMAPWVTGWGRVDAIHAAARRQDGAIVWALVDAAPGPTLAADPLRLAAVNASATVTLHFRGHTVPADRVTSIQDFDEWRARDRAGLRINGSLALGVTGRCIRLLGESPFDGELISCREALNDATADEMPGARAWASDLAMRAAARLVTAGGGRSIVLDNHAQRLAREALFLLVFGQTPAIRAAQLERGSRAL